ncbi:glycoside hydrolase family 3 C-terminal domain-containing protein [Enterococcus hirae]|uniref:glycoside hydrolase family 3 C-terminal domain-containing protein n=2 Tax=Enterococcus TaxID=1350 RepID=UPI001FF0B48B|nr:glycoside hydrolase family 3 C-terminal domain-containing protein [Enterococcus hirae]
MNKKKLVKCSLAIWLATQSLLHPFSYSYAEEWSKPDEEQVQTATSLNEPGGKNDLVENPLETMIQEPYENQPELEESIPNQKIAVIGPYGESPLTLGFWASVSGKPQDTVTLKEGLSRHFATDHLMFAKGYNLFDSYDGFGPLKKGMELLNGPIAEEESLMEEAYQISQKADVIVLTFGEQFLESGEGASKAHLQISKKQQRLIKKLHELNKPIIGVLYTGRPLVITDIEKYFDSLLLVWFPGTMGGIGIANLLAGKVSPSARLSMTFPRSEGQLPIYYAQTSTGRPISTSNHS